MASATVNRVWLLNLDAERELARPEGYTTPGALAAQIDERRELFRVLSGDDPVITSRTRQAPRGSGPSTRVVAWSPTPSALATIRRLRLSVPRAPELSILQAVNHRRFQFELARTLDPDSIFRSETRYVEPSAPLDELVRWLARGPRVGRGFRLERAFGFAGKGARRITRAPDADDRRWISRALAAGGLLVEPWVEVRAELSVHGWVDAGILLVGEPCIQECDPHGAPLTVRRLDASRRAGAVASLADRLAAAAVPVGAALRRAGYHGPFGIDSFLWSDGARTLENPLSDLNARFTLGWSTGMGRLRDEALARAEQGDGGLP